ncbi:MAG: hypothetical protein H6Q66_1760 [Firmicutes bacterium]|nr:hypothetical protein [Bacillota bacterium]
MKLTQVKEMAKGMGISPRKMNKSEIIRAIQTQEGNFPCFRTSVEHCDQETCLWHDDCISA